MLKRLLLVSFLSMFVLSTSLMSSAEAATVKRSITLTLTKSTITFGGSFTAKGTVSKSPKGTKVVIQVRSGGAWKKVATVKTTTKKGKFSHTITSDTLGTFSYRATVAKKKVKKKTLKAATSKTRKVSVGEGPAKRISLVSKAANGGWGNGTSYLWSIRQGPSLSSDGRYVAFYSEASNLVAGDTNGAGDVFLYDRLTTSTRIISKGGNARSGSPSISPDGSHVVFLSSATNLTSGAPELGVYLWERATGKIRLVSSYINGSGSAPSVSNGGAHVAFVNYGPVQGGSRWMNVYSWTKANNKITLVSHASDSASIADSASSDPQISGDGRYIVFESGADNLVSGPKNPYFQSFLWDRASDKNVKLSAWVDTGGREPSISADGRYIAMIGSEGGSGSQVYLIDRATGTRTMVSRPRGGAPANTYSEYPKVSADGSWVVFESRATNLAPDGNLDPTNGTDVFVWQRSTGTITMASRTSAGGAANSYSEMANVSADGRIVTFGSNASNLLPGDTNGKPDVFLWNRSGS